MTTVNVSEFNTIEEKRDHYLKRVDTLANERRFIDATQQEIYATKISEAESGGGVMLQAESEFLEIELAELCDSVIAEHSARNEYITRLELARIKAKSLIRSSTSVNEMYAAFKAFKQQC